MRCARGASWGGHFPQENGKNWSVCMRLLAEFFSAVNIISGNRRKKHESRLPAFSCLARQTFFWCKKSLTISKDVFRPLKLSQCDLGSAGLTTRLGAIPHQIEMTISGIFYCYMPSLPASNKTRSTKRLIVS